MASSAALVEAEILRKRGCAAAGAAEASTACQTPTEGRKVFAEWHSALWQAHSRAMQQVLVNRQSGATQGR